MKAFCQKKKRFSVLDEAKEGIGTYCRRRMHSTAESKRQKWLGCLNAEFFLLLRYLHLLKGKKQGLDKRKK